MPDKLKLLYNNLLGTKKVSQKELGDYDYFKTNLSDTNKRKFFYDYLNKKGIDKNQIGDYDKFDSAVNSYLSKPVNLPQQQPVSEPSQTQPVSQNAPVQKQNNEVDQLLSNYEKANDVTKYQKEPVIKNAKGNTLPEFEIKSNPGIKYWMNFHNSPAQKGMSENEQKFKMLTNNIPDEMFKKGEISEEAKQYAPKSYLDAIKEHKAQENEKKKFFKDASAKKLEQGAAWQNKPTKEVPVDYTSGQLGRMTTTMNKETGEPSLKAQQEEKLNDLGDKLGKLSDYLSLLENKLQTDPEAGKEYKRAFEAYQKLFSEYEPLSKDYQGKLKEFPYYIPNQDVNILSKETHIPLPVFGTLNNSILGKIGLAVLAGNPDFRNYQPDELSASLQMIGGLVVDSPLFSAGGKLAKGVTDGIMKGLSKVKLTQPLMESIGKINQIAIEDIAQGVSSREAYAKAFKALPSDALKVKTAFKVAESAQSGINLGAYNAASSALNQLEGIHKATPGTKVQVGGDEYTIIDSDADKVRLIDENGNEKELTKKDYNDVASFSAKDMLSEAGIGVLSGGSLPGAKLLSTSILKAAGVENQAALSLGNLMAESYTFAAMNPLIKEGRLPTWKEFESSLSFLGGYKLGGKAMGFLTGSEPLANYVKYFDHETNENLTKEQQLAQIIDITKKLGHDPDLSINLQDAQTRSEAVKSAKYTANKISTDGRVVAVKDKEGNQRFVIQGINEDKLDNEVVTVRQVLTDKGIEWEKKMLPGKELDILSIEPLEKVQQALTDQFFDQMKQEQPADQPTDQAQEPVQDPKSEEEAKKVVDEIEKPEQKPEQKQPEKKEYQRGDEIDVNGKKGVVSEIDNVKGKQELTVKFDDGSYEIVKPGAKQEEQIPKDKDGNVDYDALTDKPEVFMSEFSKEFGEEEALTELTGVSKAIDKKIETLRKKAEKSTSLNERAKIKREVKQLTDKNDKIKTTLNADKTKDSNTNPVEVPEQKAPESTPAEASGNDAQPPVKDGDVNVPELKNNEQPQETPVKPPAKEEVGKDAAKAGEGKEKTEAQPVKEAKKDHTTEAGKKVEETQKTELGSDIKNKSIDDLKHELWLVNETMTRLIFSQPTKNPWSNKAELEQFKELSKRAGEIKKKIERGQNIKTEAQPVKEAKKDGIIPKAGKTIEKNTPELHKKEKEYLEKMTTTLVKDLQEGRDFDAALGSIRSGILQTDYPSYVKYFIDKGIIDNDKNYIKPKENHVPDAGKKVEEPQPKENKQKESIKERIHKRAEEVNKMPEFNTGHDKREKPVDQPKEPDEKQKIKAAKKEQERIKKVKQTLSYKASQIEPADAHGIAMQYFATGGKINRSALRELYSNSSLSEKEKNQKIEEDRKHRISYVSDRLGNSIKNIAHGLWEDNPHLGHTTEDYRNAIEEIIRKYMHPATIAKDLLDHYELEERKIANHGYSDEEIADMQRVQDEEKLKEEQNDNEIFTNNIKKLEEKGLLLTPEQEAELFGHITNYDNEKRSGTEKDNGIRDTKANEEIPPNEAGSTGNDNKLSEYQQKVADEYDKKPKFAGESLEAASKQTEIKESPQTEESLLASAKTIPDLQELLALRKVKQGKAYNERMEELRKGSNLKFKLDEKSIEKSANFKRWSKDAPVLSGYRIMGAESGKPQVFRVYHGTTNDFNVFDPAVKGNVEGHFGRVNYFTSDKDDAEYNYQANGVDITGRVERRKESIEYDVENALGDDNNYKNVADEFNIPVKEIKGKSASDIAEIIAKKELLGNDEKVMELYVRLDNPVVIGGDKETYIEPYDDGVVSDMREQAKEEIKDENDLTDDELNDYESEIEDRFNELMQDEPNRIIEAAQKAAWENGIDPQVIINALPEEAYYGAISATELDKALRKDEELSYQQDENGDLANNHIIGDVFKNLGYDGIVLAHAKDNFHNMEMDPNASHIHVFDGHKNQIKLTDGTDFSESNDIRFKLTSPSEDAIASIKDPKGSPEKMKAQLLKNGAKQAELDWMGWDDFVKDKKKLTKEEIQNWIRDNKVELKEVTGSEDKGNLPESSMRNQIIKYKTKGGTNYREFLMTMPKTSSLKVTELTSDGDKWVGELSNGKKFEFSVNKADDMNEAEKYILNKEGVSYNSPHFEEPNIVVHTRTQDFTDKSGDKDLHLDEVQSDWAQEGKKKGFRGKDKLTREQLNELEDKFNKKIESEFIKHKIVKNKLDLLNLVYGDNYIPAIEPDAVPLPSLSKIVESYKVKYGEIPNWLDNLTKEGEELDKVSDYSEADLIPDMPFKKTPQWVGLGLKRMVQEAAENGYDAVTWTTGEQQAERYDLSKQVKTIAWEKNKNGKYSIDIWGMDGEPIDDVVHKNMTIDDVANLIGKEMADKIANEPDYKDRGMYEGEDLKIGGEGMHAFYDNILPKTAEKLFKKYGVKVEKTTIIGEDGQQHEAWKLKLTDKLKNAANDGFPIFKLVEKPKLPKTAGEYFAENYQKLEKEWNDELHKQLREVADDIGVKVKIVKTIHNLPPHISMEIRKQGVGDKVKGLFDEDSGEIYVISDKIKSTNDARELLLHEAVGHKGLRIALGDKFNRLLEDVYRNIPREDIARLEKLYTINGQKPSLYTIADEWLAFKAQDGSRLNYIQKAIAQIRSLIRQRYGLKYSDNDITYLFELSRKALKGENKPKTLSEYLQPKLSFMTDLWHGNEQHIKFSLAGEKGAEGLKRLDELDIARKMEKDGKDDKAIRLATNWERGADGKWRYEIPDIEIKKPLNELKDKEFTLSEIADNKDLFKAYPKLKNTKVFFYENTNSTGGFANSDKNVIGIATGSRPYRVKGRIPIYAYDNATLKSVLSHEIQHLIQKIEGFEPGTTRGVVWENLVKDKLQQFKEKDRYQNLPEERQRQVAEGELWREVGGDYQAYRSAAGEVEARNVQKRIGLTPEERRKTLLKETADVSPQDQIFLKESIGDGENVKFSLDKDQTETPEFKNIKNDKDWANNVVIKNESLFTDSDIDIFERHQDKSVLDNTHSSYHFAYEPGLRYIYKDPTAYDEVDKIYKKNGYLEEGYLENNYDPEQFRLKNGYIAATRANDNGIPSTIIGGAASDKYAVHFIGETITDIYDGKIARFIKQIDSWKKNKDNKYVKETAGIAPESQIFLNKNTGDGGQSDNLSFSLGGAKMDLSSIKPQIKNDYDLLKKDWLGNKWVKDFHADEERQVFNDRIKDLYEKEKPKGAKSWKDLSYAMKIYLDTQADPTAIERNFDKLGDRDKRIVELSQNLPQEAKDIADEIRKEFDIIGMIAEDKGVIHNTLDHYVDHLWDLPKNMTATEFWRKFGTTTSHAKQRTLGTILDGLGKGYKLKVEGVSDGLAIIKKSINPVIENRRLIEAGLNTEGEDGKKLFYTYNPGNEYRMIEHPNFVRWRKVADVKNITKQMRKDRDMIVLDDNTVLKKERIWAPKPIADNLNNILSSTKSIYGFEKFNRLTKGIILSYSYFHHMAFTTSYVLGASMHSIKDMNPIKAYKQGLKQMKALHPDIDILVRNGLTLGRNQDYGLYYKTQKGKIAKLLDKHDVAPGIRDKIKSLYENHTEFLFNKLGAGLKAKAALMEYSRIIKDNPEIDHNKAAYMSAKLINADFGGLNHEQMGRNAGVNRFLRGVLLAPDWTESNVLTMVRAFGVDYTREKGERKLSKQESALYRRFWTRVAIRGAVATTMMNLMMTLFNQKDNETYWDALTRMYKEMFKYPERLNWLSTDITPVYRGWDKLLQKLGFDTKPNQDERRYLNLFRHFLDPAKWVIQSTIGKEASPLIPLGHKASVISRIFLDIATGSNWIGKRYSTWDEFWGNDDKGRYSTNKPNPKWKPGDPLSEKYIYKAGDPKGGKYKHQLTKWGSPTERGWLPWRAVPSFIAATARDVLLPIPISNMVSTLMGEQESFDMFTRGVGFYMHRTNVSDFRDIQKEYANHYKDAEIYIRMVNTARKDGDRDTYYKLVKDKQYIESRALLRANSYIKDLKERYNEALNRGDTKIADKYKATINEKMQQIIKNNNNED